MNSPTPALAKIPKRVKFLFCIAKLLDFAAQNEIQVICFTFHRTQEEQTRLFLEGKSKVRFSKHQEWLAMDFALIDDVNEDGKIDPDEIRWRDDPRYEELGRFWESLGGRWGGRWKTPHDPYHFEAGEDW